MAPNIVVTLVLLIGLFQRWSSATAAYNVVSFGARGDGKTDSTKAFLRAWSAACSTSLRGEATVYVPRGSFLIKPVVFSGPCRSSRVTFQMDDTGTSLTMHMAIDNCKNVVVKNVKITAPSSSPNTDGIHIEASTGVTISGSTIMTGDDCISIGSGSKNLWLEHIACGPGHGISIGSLGDNANEDGVQNVTVTSCVFTKTQNGVRIKTWARASNGYATNIVFRNLIMQNVNNPIIIDQKYCPNQGCPRQSSGVKISRVTYTNIRGTSASKVAMNFYCSSSNPCWGLKLQDIRLTYLNKAATSYCANAGGSSSGVVIPRSCF
ncbi:hypothetical protein ACE6H2_025765 [Prunus campanulata]